MGGGGKGDKNSERGIGYRGERDDDERLVTAITIG